MIVSHTTTAAATLPRLSWVVLSAAHLCGAALSEIPFRSDFSSGTEPFRRLFHYHGEAVLTTDLGKAPPEETVALRIDFPEVTKTMVGLELAAEAGDRLRVSLAGTTEFSAAGRTDIAFTCHDSAGKRLAWVGLGPFPQGSIYQSFRSELVELPPGTARIRLFVFFSEVKGSAWLGDVAVTRAESLPPHLEAKLRSTGRTRWGVNDFLAARYTARADLSDTCAKLMAAAGFEEARLAVWWGSREQLSRDIQAGGWVVVDRGDDGAYDFSELERILARVEYYGVAPGVVVVHGTPEWASGRTRADVPEGRARNWRAQRRPFFPPRDWADYETFVGALVARCRGRVRTWEVLNEPNTPDSGLHYGWQDCMAYITHFHRAAKRADPDANVVAGRVGRPWMGHMLKAGLGDEFDGVVSHPYAKTAASSVAAARQLQLIMAEHGVVKPLYITEIGLGEWHKVADPAAYERDKARYARDVLRGLSALSDVVYWWTSCRPGNQHGLLRDDRYCLRPTPAYWAAAEVIGRLKRRNPAVRAEVSLSAASVRVGETAGATLCATNRLEEPVSIRFFPVGFLSTLGVTPEHVGSSDWRGRLRPGESHTVRLAMAPDVDASGGRFPVGLAVLSDRGNSLALCDLAVPAAATGAKASASAGAGEAQNLEALNDRVYPALSWDIASLHFVWPNRRGTPEWVEYEFGAETTVHAVDVMWLDTTRRRTEYRPPASWRLTYRDGSGEWRPVHGAGEYGTEPDMLNRVEFSAVRTEALRLRVQLRAGFGAGIHEWRVWE